MEQFPIAECFLAPQGEGFNTGKLMIFLRLAGCTVGKTFSEQERTHFNILNDYQTKCTLADAREFACDTNYKMSQKLNLDEIIELLKREGSNCKVVCLTGGEPLMHKNLFTLVRHLVINAYLVVLETSGTIPLTKDIKTTLILMNHVAISPKKGFLFDYINYADEIKILIDENFEWNLFPFIDDFCLDEVFLQPVNGEHTVNMDNIQRCLDIQLQHPEVRISTQAHKLWGTK